MIDIHTLLFASVTARTGFILIFLIASFRSEARLAFRFWSASILGSAVGVMLIYSDPNYPYFLAARGMLIYAIIGISLSCIWAGGRVFSGGRVNKAVFAVMGLTPGLVYGGARFLGLVPDIVVLLTIVTLVASTAIAARAFLARKRAGYLPSQLLVSVALSTYSLALTASLVMIAFRLLTPGGVPDLQAADISLALFIDQLTSVLIYVGLVSMSLEDVQARMKELATTDPLTGLANRRGVQEQTSALIAACNRAKRPLSVLIADLDHFKSINDHYGHDCGDMVLREFARRMSCLCRRGQDVTGRWGGEEFLVVLSDMTPAEAVCFAEQLLKRISEELFDIGKQKIAVTVSIGVAGFCSGVTPLAVAVTAADEALYEAKRNGRNCVHCVVPGTTPPQAHVALAVES
ncbi:diguanylate cyclase (GGDEF)-like protein [Rhizobium sp. PP-F2F-G38]|uniref:GGDEF domain-containing protein n=1 Tax=Rhizobium sp. PP-CC-3G-465 TaxID=2135648 RepID=UPI000D8F38DC|nr:diguanylate cyclase (GGDEF)-like protein [Rhizobium sp. PP-WC-1G-195]PYE93594.1 diguanylate cyclase (GGDEF)-like protein [Rhizobium sp. PP-F2F-G38]TCL88915.1 diguanylate cyclase (GGDEF)-like protein [Rhizobium sp. PP-WC-2G-219]TCP80726.1 diguanylate cyclase (GGDEF)-like protein [Rhizobium sp. PP-CC-2G-626]TCQ03544.1 diguanylate cyclase (GGDEF)-like protein [Rhizobium sp. PP-F2F-G36]TCQ19371.1 diguanylate cyclase (GGDEF)-like protein [Rhizobium sp. PP-CC-3G-465]